MKKLAITAALVAMTAGAASAMTSPVQLINGVQNDLDHYVSNVDVHALSDAQIVALHFILTSGDNEGDKRGEIRAILN